jgi:hypothetical protein
MSQPFLPPDDLPPAEVDQLDGILRRQLEDAIGRCFYEACDGVTQSLLTSCEWYITTKAIALTLVINCPDLGLNWRVLNNIVPLGTRLEQFSASARIRISPPVGTGAPFEVRVDEISVYRDSP